LVQYLRSRALSSSRQTPPAGEARCRRPVPPFEALTTKGGIAGETLRQLEAGFEPAACKKTATPPYMP
jgi:hypothetical protein